MFVQPLNSLPYMLPFGYSNNPPASMRSTQLYIYHIEELNGYRLADLLTLCHACTTTLCHAGPLTISRCLIHSLSRWLIIILWLP